MPRDLLIVFGNDTNPGVVQTWAISNQNSQDVDPGDAAFFDITVGGNANIGFSVEANGNTLYTSLRYAYNTDTYTLVPDYPQYFTISVHQNRGAEVQCTYSGRENALLGYTIKSLEVKSREK
ncbi:hypothetical protein MKX08_008008 [Trichoderma sp. CBMAI-0020]|nr:hypothetical protein MKX08_008008 [Trichoderma sp. CBMAI-0020]WOD45577.1 hypothetical protein [Trichoderma atroviride]